MENVCYNAFPMWKSYLKEREGSEVLEFEHGFAVVRELVDCLYLQDIYVKPEHRNSGYGRKILAVVEDAAKDMGFKYVLGSCSPKAEGSTASLQAILACGFELSDCEKDIIYLRKPLKD